MHEAMRFVCLALLPLVALLACEPPLFPPDATQYTPPLRYRTLWRTVESCGGSSGDFEAVSWWATQRSPAGAGQPDAAGAWWPDRNAIYIKTPFLNSDQVIRHEMLHAVLQDGAHGAVFLGACGGLVVCEANCEEDAGGRSPPATIGSDTILPAALEVTINVISPLPGDDGWSSVVVAARNPFAAPVWVDLGGRPGVQFECLRTAVQCSAPDQTNETYSPFRAGATRRWVSVFRVSTPGSFEIIGAFNTKQSAPDTLVVP